MAERLIILAGGGTSGHVNPALAIADALMEEDQKNKVLFIGRRAGIEYDLVTRAGYSFSSIQAAPLPTRLSWRLFSSFYYFYRGRQQSRRILKKSKPRLVVGTGGYVCSPVISAAHSLGIPVLLHEQNAYPGRSNRLMARKSQAICVAFPGTEHYFSHPERVVVTGNPVREQFFRQEREAARQSLLIDQHKPLILAMGGSLGAQTINNAVLGLSDWIEKRKRKGRIVPLVVLAAGSRQFKTVREAGAAYSDWLTVVEYLHDMPRWLSAADLAVARAGALTCSELSAVGRPAILVPYPHAAGNHQEYNARLMADNGAAILCPDDRLTAESLAEILEELLEKPQLREEMAKKALLLAKPEATARILQCLSRIENETGKKRR